MGHQLDVRRDYSTAKGRGQAVMHDSKANVNYGPSHARADGSAEPEPRRGSHRGNDAEELTFLWCAPSRRWIY
jgi:hypothetical protein